MYDARSAVGAEMKGSRVLVLVLMPALGAPAFAAGPDVTDVTRRQALEHYRAGQELMYAEAWEQAEREFKAAIGLDPLMVLAHYGLGQTYMAQKLYPEAIRAFTGAIGAHREI